MSVKSQMIRARDLMKAGQYGEAREILKTIDHPVAHKWIKKLDRQIAKQFSLDSSDDTDFEDEPSQSRRPNSSTTSDHSLTDLASTSSDSTSIFNVIALLLLTVVLSLVGAGLMTAVVIWGFYAPIIWGSLAGLYGYFTLRLGVKFTKVRDGMVGVALGALAGLIIWSGFYGMMFVYDRQQINIELGSPEYFDDILSFETGQTGIIGYFIYRSKLGIPLKIKRTPIDIKGTPLLIMMLLELPAVMIGLAVTTRERTLEPFCNAQNDWVKFKKLGHVPPQTANEFLHALADGDYDIVRTIIQSKASSSQSQLTIYVGQCESQGYLRIEATKIETSFEGTHNVTLEVVQVLTHT